MNIVLKNSLRNITGKPFRTLLVIFTIFMCCMSALLSFDIGSLIERIMETYYGNVSRADIIVYAGGRDLTDLPEGFPECDTMYLSNNSEKLYIDIEGEYNYVSTDALSIFGLDIDEAVDMEFLSPMELSDGMIYVTQKYADDFGCGVGDTVVVHDRAYEEVELTVGGILPDDSKNTVLSGYSAVVNLETADILCCGNREPDMVMIDIRDDSRIDEAKDLYKAQYPGITIQDMFISDSLMNVIHELEVIFYLLFAAAVLLVIFVTSSICNRIVSERMSYIGTLRSLGMSSSRTARILLLENVLYAILGAVPAIIIYQLLRSIVISSLVGGTESMESLGIVIPPVSGALIAGVLAGAVVMECLIPLKAILRALKISIRDIIFDNRDTAYRYGKISLVFGIIFLILSVVLAVINSNLGTAILCLLTTIGALTLLFPRILKLVTELIRKISDKTGHTRWSLAAVEASSRKSTVGSGILCASAAAMCVVVVTVAGFLFGISPEVPYECDIVATCVNSMKYYSYVDGLEGVTDTEPVYCASIQVAVNDEDTSVLAFLFGLPEGGFRYYTELEGLPDSIPENGIVVDSSYARRKGIDVGDTVTFVFDPDSVLPIVKDYTIAALVDDISNGGVECFLVPEREYISLYRDIPSELLVCCDDPEAVSEAMQTYGKGTFTQVKTKAELETEREVNGAAVNAVIYVVIAIAIGMTAIGVISNLLIGFEGRKKECAVMLSTAMDKKTLSGILFREVFITSMTASGIGTAVGTFLLNLVAKALRNSDTFSIKLDIDYKQILVFFVILAAVFTATVIFPIRNLRKMKISEQIKYE